MAQPYVGEIRLFAGSFPPVGWVFCDGQLMPISENETLFNLIGTTYGGDGQETFAIPNLQSRVPVHMGQGTGSNYQIGESGGVESVTLTTQQIPAHSHAVLVSADQGSQSTPTNEFLGSNPTVQIFRPGNPPGAKHISAVSPVGGSQPHDNMQPYAVVSYILSLFGIFPSQT